MRAWLGALALVGCASAPGPVDHAMPRPAPSALSEPSALAPSAATTPAIAAEPRDAGCKVAGPIERLTLYADEGLKTPLLASWRALHVRLSHFRPGDEIVRVHLAGHRLARVDGWARFKLDSRLFTRKRLVSAPTRFTIPEDTRLQGDIMASLRDGMIRLQIETEFRDPEVVTFEVPCSDLALRPAIIVEARPVVYSKSVKVLTKELSFHATPEEPAFLHAEPLGEELWLTEHERRGGFVRVTHHAAWAQLDGWVPASAVEEDATKSGHGNLCGSVHRQRPPRLPAGDVVTIRVTETTRDAKLWIGASPEGDAVGTVEQGALVKLEEEHGEAIAFTFVSGALAAPDGSRLWVESAAIGAVDTIEERGARHRALSDAESARLAEIAVAAPSGCGH